MLYAGSIPEVEMGAAAGQINPTYYNGLFIRRMYCLLEKVIKIRNNALFGSVIIPKWFPVFCLRASVFAEFSADDRCQPFFRKADSPDRGTGDDDQREEDQTFRRARVTAPKPV